MGEREVMDIEYFGYISALCFFLGYIPQLVRTYRLKTVDDISVEMWWLTFAAYSTGLVYGIWLGKTPLLLSYTLGFCCTTLMLVMYYIYISRSKEG